MRGGKRPGAGRPPTGRKRRIIYLTATEYEKVRQYIKQMREGKTTEEVNRLKSTLKFIKNYLLSAYDRGACSSEIKNPLIREIETSLIREE